MRNTLRRTLWLLVTLALAVGFVDFRLQSSTVYIGADLSALVAGEGHLPYQYRALVPAVVRALRSLNLTPYLGELLAPLHLDAISSALNTNPEMAAPFVLCEILAAWGLLLSFRVLSSMFSASPTVQAAGSIAILLPIACLPMLTPDSRLWYPSDIPAVLVVVLSYIFLFEGRVALFYPLFILGTLNRETTLFLLPLLMYLPADVLKTRFGVAHAALLFVVWAAIKTGLFYLFRGNHGYPVHPNIVINIEMIQDPRVFGTVIAVVLGFALLFVESAYRCGDQRLKAAFKAAALFLVAIFLAGKLDEMRVYMEFVPLLVLAAVARVSRRS